MRLELIICTKLLKCWPMCKKIYSVLLVLLCSAGMFAAETGELKGAHPWKLEQNENGVAPKFAHWTIAIGAGFNSFDGDFASEMKHPVWYPAANFAIEYNFTPMWLLGVEYTFDMYRVTGLNNNQHASILLEGMMHKADAYLGFDLMSACYPRSPKKIFILDLFAGGGAGWFQNSTYYPDEARQHTADYTPLKDDKYRVYPCITAGVLFGFNLGRVTALGIKGEYSYFVKDLIDGRGSSLASSKNNDGIFDITLNLRFKLASVKKTHVKNISSYDIFDKMNEQDRLKDTLVVSHVDTLYMIAESTATAGMATFREDDYFFIYFDHNKNGLDDKALIDVQQIATRMKHEPDMCAEIIGYADNTGADEHNQNLGVARAQNIRDELVEEHNIDPSRITYSSGGTIIGGRSTGAYSPNRRADVRLMPCGGEFESLKQANDDRSAMAAEAQAQAMAERENGVITAPEGMTLSAIARKYYGNTYCWVFIYDANKTTLKSPNYIPAGTRLVIPDLDEDQINISKRNAEIFYDSIK